MYKILGTDQKEYGPVSMEMVRQWIADRRANAQTRAQADGSAEWKPLSQFPEFSDALAAGGRPPTLPTQPMHAGAGRIAPEKTSGLAIASLVLGVLGFFSCGLTALVGLILGIVSLVQIRKSQGRLGGQGLAIAGTCVSGILLLLMPVSMGLLLPALAKAKGSAQGINCVNNLKQLGLAVRIYSNDNKDTLPQAENWCDAILPNLGSAKVFQCNAASNGQRSHYAYNARLSGMAEGKVDPRTVLIFEIDGGWNVSGGPELMITRPRHKAYNICHEDGSVEQVSKSGLSRLRWDP